MLDLPRLISRALGALLILTIPLQVLAADAVKSFDVPAGRADRTLKQFSQQSGREVICPMELARTVQTPSLKGDYTPQEALDLMLAGTGFVATRDEKSGAFSIARNDPNVSGAAPGSDRPQTDTSARTGNVSGAVIRPPGGASVKGLTVSVAGSDRTGFTDSFGRFSISNLAPGVHTLSISGPGYATLKIQGVAIHSYTETRLAAETMPSSDSPDGITVDARQQSDVIELAKYEVMGRKPFVDENMDIVRTMNDAQPYYILNSQQIEQSGATNVGDFLKKRLPMDATFQANSQNYYATGNNSSINLRGLGSNETLILIDGRRTAGISVQGNSVQPDLNGLPLAAIDRIEVLPSSASAIYGGAAVGGVVNVILKKNYQGGELSYTYDTPADVDVPLHTVDLSYGFALEGGRTHVMITGHYAEGEPLLTEHRPELFRRGVANILRNDPAFLHSPTTPFPGATPNIASADGSNLVLKDGTPLGSRITHVPVGAAPGTDISAALRANAGRYNLEPAQGSGLYGMQNYFALVPRGKSVIGKVRREMTPWLEVFTSFSHETNSSVSQRNHFSFSPLLVTAASPHNPFRQNVRVNFPSGVSIPLNSDSETQRLSAGFIATLPGDWKVELDYTWSKNFFEVAQSSSDPVALRAAVLAGTANPFVDTTAYPVDLARFLGPQGYDGRSTLNNLGLRASGAGAWLPWGSVTLTVGLEHRKEGNGDSRFFAFRPLTPANNLVQRFFGQSQSTNSVYLEAGIPIVNAKNALPFVQSLDLQVAGRSEKYDVGAGTPFAYVSPPALVAMNPPQGVHKTIEYTSTNPTIGVRYSPVEGVILRASYAEAFLPPIPAQLLPDPTPSPFPETIIDPKNGQTYDVGTTYGGNAALRPQTSEAWNFGLIWEPKAEALKGLRFNLERYQISQPNRISVATVQEVVSTPELSSRVTRDPVTGLVTSVDLSYLNAQEYETAGWDLSVAYRRHTAWGTFDLYAVGTEVSHDRRQYAIRSALLDYAGYPAEGGVGKRKANLSLTWEHRGWTVGWTTTYYGSYRQAYSPGSPGDTQFGGGITLYTAPQGSDTIPSQHYHEVFARHDFGRSAGRFESGWARHILSDLSLQVGVKNVFNTLPPYDVFYDPYFYSTYGDPRLRSIWVRLKKSF